MTRSQRLNPVRRLAQDEADAAAKRYAEAKQRLEAQLGKLAQLENYRNDYAGQRSAIGGDGIDPFRLRDYNAFMARIDAAVSQQRQQVSETEASVEQARQHWMQLLSRARALDKVVTRYQDEERRDADRRDQRQLDELAQRRARPDKD